jgi:arginyl-tRNA synthetase
VSDFFIVCFDFFFLFVVDNWETMCYNSVTIIKRGQIMSTAATTTENILEYKGHPLRRKDNLIYYGSMTDKYIIMLQVTETKKVKDMDVATRVIVQLQLTDPNLKSRDRVVKKSEKSSFYAAIDVAAVWLERALTSK